jgi:hypothetical protein
MDGNVHFRQRNSVSPNRMTAMNKTPRFSLILLGLSLPLVGACNRSGAPAPAATPASTASTGSAPETVLGKTVEGAMRKARRELETQNIDIGDGMKIGVGKDGRNFRIGNASDGSKAQLTPKGDLLIDGKAVPVTAQQRAMLLDYRRQIIAVAETGMSIGVKGADLAGKAVLETFSGLMHGDADEAGKRIDAAGKRIEAEAHQICAQLPPLLDTQQRLAASLPAFKPYANMTREDIDDCMKGDGVSVTDGRDEIRQEIRERIRGSVQSATQADADEATSKPTSTSTR